MTLSERTKDDQTCPKCHTQLDRVFDGHQTYLTCFQRGCGEFDSLLGDGDLRGAFMEREDRQDRLYKDIGNLETQVTNLEATVSDLRAQLAAREVMRAGLQVLAETNETRKYEFQDLLNKSEAKVRKMTEALEKIRDPRKRDHQEPDAYTQLGCVMSIANEVLETIKKEFSK